MDKLDQWINREDGELPEQSPLEALDVVIETMRQVRNQARNGKGKAAKSSFQEGFWRGEDRVCELFLEQLEYVKLLMLEA